MAHKRIAHARAVLVIVPVLLAAVAGAVYGSWTHIAGSSNEETSTGGVPVSSDTVALALASAADRVDFSPLVPTYLPTHADEIVLVDASAGPVQTANGLRLVELIYQSADEVEIDGVMMRSTLEMFQTNIRLNEANGEIFATDLAGYEVHRDVVSVGSAGEAVKVTYTARTSDWTFVMDFTGTQPDEDGLGQMLSSMKPFGS